MATKKAVSKSGKSTAKKPTTSTTTVKEVKAEAKKNMLSATLTTRTPMFGAGLAEFIGTFLLASIVITGQGQPIIVMFGLIGIVFLVGSLSGAHLNPAMTLGALATRRIRWTRALLYIIAQFLGAVAALGALTAFIGSADQSQSAYYGSVSLFTASALPEGKEWYVFFAELLGTAILGYAVAAALRAKEKVTSSLTVGFGIFIALMVAVSAASYAGGSAAINPAIAASLEALSWSVWPLAVYILAPAIGGVIGFFLSDLLASNSDGGSDK